MKKFSQLSLTLLAGAMAVAVACSDDDDDNGGGMNNNVPANNNNDGGNDNNNNDGGNDNNNNDAGPSVTLRFTIDDTANNTFQDIGASFSWNDFDRSGGDRPALTNDGTGLWSVDVDYPIPAMDETFNYGANAVFTDSDDWIWAYDSRHTGSYTVPADANDGDVIDVAGLTIPAFGDWNMRATIDTSSLAAGFTGDPSLGVGVKTNRNGFGLVVLNDDGTNGDETASDGVYTFDMDAQATAAAMGTSMSSVGLMAPGERVEFTWVIGGTEYKIDGGERTGVAVELTDTSTPTNPWVPASVVRLRSDRNTGVIATSSTSQYDIRILVDTSTLSTTQYTATSTVYFSNTWIVEQENGTFTAPQMFDNGRFGDETADDGVYTLVLSEWVGGQWVSDDILFPTGGNADQPANDADLRSSTLLAAGPDPLGRDPVMSGSEAVFKIRFDANGYYESLQGVTVQFKRPGEDTWNDIANVPTTGPFNNFQLIIPE